MIPAATHRLETATTSAAGVSLLSVRRAWIWIAAAAVAVAATVEFWPAPAFHNGSFESGLQGWTVKERIATATADRIHPATDGRTAVVLNPGDETGVGSSLSQTFRTVPGQRYELAFDFGTTGAIADQKLHTTVRGRSVLLDSTVIAAALSDAPFYVPQRLEFTADSAATTVTFADKSVTYVTIDALLDNVRIQPRSEHSPVIAAQPGRTAAAEGGTATFRVGASCTGACSYQWRFADRAIDGATSDTLIVKNATRSDAGNYDVTITSLDGSTRSSAATLTVLPPGVLLNGSFEYGSAAWTFVGLQSSTSTNAGYGVTDGRELAHFNWGQGPPGGSVSQRFATEPGRTYIVEFDAGTFSLKNHDQQRVELSLTGDVNLLTSTVTVASDGKGGHYEHERFQFVADSNTTTITFRDVSERTENIDLLLDNVHVTAGAFAH
jgi:uncharacterized protein DUF642